MKKFTDLPLAVQMAIFAVVAVIIIAVGEFYYPDLQAMDATNKVAKEKLDKQLAENSTVKPYEQKFKDIQVENKQLEYQLSNLNSVLPAEKDTDGFIKMVQEAGVVSGVEIRRFTAGAPAIKETYVELPFDLEIDGNFTTVLQFFDKMSKLPRIVNVANLAIGPLSGSVRGVRRKYLPNPNDTVQASFIATTFFRKEVQAPGKGAPPPPPKK
jgi:type IV pilus assembly protein PilO